MLNIKHLQKLFLLLFPLWGIGGLLSCEDWLSEPQPASTNAEDFFIAGGGAAAIQAVNGAYVPLQWEYGRTYSPEWWIGDVASDDAIKGGGNIGDMSEAYDIENFKTQTNNTILLDWYQLNFQGIARCNFVLEQVSKVKPDSLMNEKTQKRLLAETKFLRALYYFRLVRVFGSVPLVTVTIQSSAQWRQPNAAPDAIYTQILKDLTEAEPDLWTRTETHRSAADVGRATQGAAQAMLLKVNLYRKNYTEAKRWGNAIVNSAEYDLEVHYGDNFSVFNENGIESVFEVQYGEDPTSDYGDFNPHFGSTRGTFTTILTRSRSTFYPRISSGGASTGYGFRKPTQDLYDEFEAGDARREASVVNPHDSMITNPSEEIYLGNRYVSRKYTLMDDNLNSLWNGHATRAPINIQLIRYADVLLMYAEACVEDNDLATAKTLLEQVRARARQECSDPTTQLKAFPDYINRRTGANYTNDAEGLRWAVRHERRVELAMESHRWFDIVRWGIAKETMDAYKAAETPEARAEMADFIAPKHELFPLPQAEIDLSGTEQSDLWK
ncbi:membrane protein [Bacteroidia bacterium]|nr:membrane protein [Bacteroidia bacterium]